MGLGCERRLRVRGCMGPAPGDEGAWAFWGVLEVQSSPSPR